jgi:hypothetical protein
VAVLINVAPLYCARNSCDGVALIVTPAPAATVTCPAPTWARSIFVPTANGTLEFGGTVNVIGLALLSVTRTPRPSAATSVYVVPVCALIVSVEVAAAPVAPVPPVPPVAPGRPSMPSLPCGPVTP